jgi:hypothetical protein
MHPGSFRHREQFADIGKLFAPMQQCHDWRWFAAI